MTAQEREHTGREYTGDREKTHTEDGKSGRRERLNVYDFDNTIYDGESSFDFFLFFVRRYPWVVRYLPRVALVGIRYRLGRLSERELFRAADRLGHVLVRSGCDLQAMAGEFWEENRGKIRAFYLRRHRDDDVIVSASPRFLLEGIARELGVRSLICSELDVRTGALQFACFRDRKAEAFRRQFPDAVVQRYYTDTAGHDAQMIALAEHAYLIRGERGRRIK